MRLSLPSGAVLASLLHVLAVPAQTSGMFRGDASHRGIYPATGDYLAGLAWRVVAGGDVIASPAVVGGTAYVGSGAGVLLAIDARIGQVRWRDSLGSAVNGSPAVALGRVYVTTRSGELIAFDAATGARRWRIATGHPKPMPWGHESGDYYESSPAVARDVVVFGARDGRLYAVDAATGRRRWQAETGGQIWSSPAIDRERVFVGSADGFVYCFGLSTGALVWRFATEGTTLESARFGFDRRTVESSPAVMNGTVYVGARDGFLYAIDAESGKLRWRFDHKTSWVVTSPAVTDTVVYAGSSDGAFVQAVDARTGIERWRTRTGGIVWSSPAVSGHTVYVGDGVGRIHALDAETGVERWVFRTGESVHSSPVVSDSLVIFGSADGAVYALRTTNGAPPARAVFFDSSLTKAASTDDPPLIARYFRNRGYSVVDQVGLDAFLAAQATSGARSVVVFATDVIRDPAGLRRYLERGGKVIWPGIPPGIWPRDSATGTRRGYASIGWDAPERLLGVDHAASSFDEHSARPTRAGLVYALAPYRGSWGVDTTAVTTPLAIDDWGHATAWIQRLVPKAGTGFVRTPSGNLLAMFLLAESLTT